jgi:hypothetical protein
VQTRVAHDTNHFDLDRVIATISEQLSAQPLADGVARQAQGRLADRQQIRIR